MVRLWTGWNRSVTSNTRLNPDRWGPVRGDEAEAEMTNDEAYRKLIACGTSSEGAQLVLTYAYWAQLFLSGWLGREEDAGNGHPAGSGC